MKDYMDELNGWADMYDKAQEDGVFEAAPKPVQPNLQTSDNSFFGLVNTDPTEEVSDVDAEYWQQVYERTEETTPFGGVAGEIEIQYEDDEINESVVEEADKKGKPGDVAKAMLDSPNPIHPTSAGKDQELKPTPNWCCADDDSKGVVEVEELKRKLYDLECKLSGPDGLKESAPKIDKQLEAMKKKIDELSDRLNPNYWTERES